MKLLGLPASKTEETHGVEIPSVSLSCEDPNWGTKEAPLPPFLSKSQKPKTERMSKMRFYI